MKKPHLLGAVFCALLSLGTCGTAIAGTLDQSYIDTPDFGVLVSDKQHMAQTFTVGLAGQLTSIDAWLFTGHPSTTGIYTLNLLDTVGGIPGSSILASGTYDPSGTNLNQFINFDISSYNVFVDVGDVLAFSLEGSVDSFLVAEGNASGAYSQGANYFTNSTNPNWTINGSIDLLFQTYVDETAVPIPPAFYLFGSGLLGLVGMGRRKKA